MKTKMKWKIHRTMMRKSRRQYKMYQFAKFQSAQYLTTFIDVFRNNPPSLIYANLLRSRDHANPPSATANLGTISKPAFTGERTTTCYLHSAKYFAPSRFFVNWTLIGVSIISHPSLSIRFNLDSHFSKLQSISEFINKFKSWNWMLAFDPY